MGIFLTGATGYIGSYLAAALLEQHGDELNLLVRASSLFSARTRLNSGSGILCNCISIFRRFANIYPRAYTFSAGI
jgi:thioester reductase-like protein